MPGNQFKSKINDLDVLTYHYENLSKKLYESKSDFGIEFRPTRLSKNNKIAEIDEEAYLKLKGDQKRSNFKRKSTKIKSLVSELTEVP